jgi:hypothetical protein
MSFGVTGPAASSAPSGRYLVIELNLIARRAGQRKRNRARSGAIGAQFRH